MKFRGSSEDKGPASPFDDPTSIGNIALEKGYITKDILGEALKVQEQRLKLGDILVELGHLSPEQRDELVMEQKIRRGEIKDPKQIIDFEKKKQKSRLDQIKKSYARASDSAADLKSTFAATANAWNK